MPLSDNERRAVQAHAKVVDDYDTQRAAEEKRLWEPHAARQAELMELGITDAGPTPWGTRLDRCLTTDENREAFGNIDSVNAKLVAFDTTHKPKLEPWDTPMKIHRDIEDESFHWSERKNIMVECSGFANDKTTRKARELDHQSDAYPNALKRVLAFVSIAPSVLNDFPAEHEPLIGLHRIQAWCVDAMRVPGEPVDTPVGGKRKHRQTKQRDKLTAKQLEAVEVFGKCECNYSKAAKMLGVSTSAARERIEAAYHKLGQSVPTKPKTQRLPHDKRGGVAIATSKL